MVSIVHEDTDVELLLPKVYFSVAERSCKLSQLYSSAFELRMHKSLHVVAGFKHLKSETCIHPSTNGENKRQ
eukprot:m.87096 g.87096  ORF g.87096 m.87096 type:complete len:72 (+) comp16392_c0_seq2:989-1204(+)